MTPPDQFPTDETIREAAARWTVRRDRGLSASESIEFELWLAADERHAAAVNRSAGAWSMLNRLPEEIARQTLQQATRHRSFWRRTAVVGALAAAAVVAVAALSWRTMRVPKGEGIASASQAATEPRTLALSDGTVVHLNTGSEFREEFTAGERRVSLLRGEAHFSVTKNPARPFIVRAGNVEVRAVGTAFNVHLQSAAVEVLVTEGVVKLKSGAVQVADSIPALNSGHRAVVALAPVSRDAAVVVTTVSPEEISRALAWQEPWLHLGGATLAEVAVNFERRTGRRMILADPGIAELRLGGRFRADDIEGFTHLLAANLDLDVELSADGTILLRKKKSVPR